MNRRRLPLDSKAQIKKFLKDRITSPIADGDDIFSLGLVDSLFAMQLVLFVEQEFEIHVENEDLDINNFCSVDAINKFVSAKQPA